jgi:hypothetical protein
LQRSHRLQNEGPTGEGLAVYDFKNQPILYPGFLFWIKTKEGSCKNVQSSSTNTHQTTGGSRAGQKKTASKSNDAIRSILGDQLSGGPWDANKHSEPPLRPPWNLQMVYSGICFPLAKFHHY